MRYARYAAVELTAYLGAVAVFVGVALAVLGKGAVFVAMYVAPIGLIGTLVYLALSAVASEHLRRSAVRALAGAGVAAWIVVALGEPAASLLLAPPAALAAALVRPPLRHRE